MQLYTFMIATYIDFFLCVQFSQTARVFHENLLVVKERSNNTSDDQIGRAELKVAQSLAVGYSKLSLWAKWKDTTWHVKDFPVAVRIKR